MIPSERDQLVLSLLNYVTPLLRRYAANYRQLLTFDDLYQDACIHIMGLIDAGVAPQDLQCYAYNRVRSRIIDKIRYLTRRLSQSLDARVFEEREDVTFGDLLPSPYYSEPLVILLAQEHITALLPRIASLPRGRIATAQELGVTALASL